MEYRGNISVTTSGRKCQRWDSHSPHTHEYDRLFHEGASVNKNYCRNPKTNDEPTPWCYTTDPDVRFELCDVPVCGKVHFIYHGFRVLIIEIKPTRF